MKAETRDDVLASFREAEIGGYELEFVRMADLMLQIVKDTDFPKSRREAQINFHSSVNAEDVESTSVWQALNQRTLATECIWILLPCAQRRVGRARLDSEAHCLTNY